jgi:hypothetical protein
MIIGVKLLEMLRYAFECREQLAFAVRHCRVVGAIGGDVIGKNAYVVG